MFCWIFLLLSLPYPAVLASRATLNFCYGSQLHACHALLAGKKAGGVSFKQTCLCLRSTSLDCNGRPEAVFTWSCRKFPRHSHFLSSYRQQHWRFKTSLSQHLSRKDVFFAMFLPSIGHLGHEDLVREKNPEADNKVSIGAICSNHTFRKIKSRIFKLGNLHCS